jgi:ubiquinone/menaquinone biosynthesis C-methylase UbiE
MKPSDIFFELHSGNTHEAPGDFSNTQRAYAALPDLAIQPLILDIGCGTGRQSLDLLRLSQGTIIAFDLHRPFIQTVQQQLCKRKALRLRPLQADMRQLPFQESRFDVIWSEGAIYNIGFASGLRNWSFF